MPRCLCYGDTIALQHHGHEGDSIYLARNLAVSLEVRLNSNLGVIDWSHAENAEKFFLCAIFIVTSDAGSEIELAGKPVKYGSNVRLILKSTGEYLCSKLGSNINSSDFNSKFEHSTTGISREYYFKMESRYKMRPDGDMIMHDDIVYMRDMEHRYLYVGMELQPFFIFGHGLHSGFRIKCIQEFQNDSTLLRNGDVICLMHTENAAFISGEFSDTPDISSVFHRRIDVNSESVLEPLSFWQIENDSADMISSTSRLRLRHLLTGQYLTTPDDQAIGLSAVPPGIRPGSIFAFQPITSQPVDDVEGKTIRVHDKVRIHRVNSKKGSNKVLCTKDNGFELRLKNHDGEAFHIERVESLPVEYVMTVAMLRREITKIYVPVDTSTPVASSSPPSVSTEAPQILSQVTHILQLAANELSRSHGAAKANKVQANASAANVAERQGQGSTSTYGQRVFLQLGYVNLCLRLAETALSFRVTSEEDWGGEIRNRLAKSAYDLLEHLLQGNEAAARAVVAAGGVSQMIGHLHLSAAIERSPPLLACIYPTESHEKSCFSANDISELILSVKKDIKAGRIPSKEAFLVLTKLCETAHGQSLRTVQDLICLCLFHDQEASSIKTLLLRTGMSRDGNLIVSTPPIGPAGTAKGSSILQLIRKQGQQQPLPEAHLQMLTSSEAEEVKQGDDDVCMQRSTQWLPLLDMKDGWLNLLDAQLHLFSALCVRNFTAQKLIQKFLPVDHLLLALESTSDHGSMVSTAKPSIADLLLPQAPTASAKSLLLCKIHADFLDVLRACYVCNAILVPDLMFHSSSSSRSQADGEIDAVQEGAPMSVTAFDCGTDGIKTFDQVYAEECYGKVFCIGSQQLDYDDVAISPSMSSTELMAQYHNCCKFLASPAAMSSPFSPPADFGLPPSLSASASVSVSPSLQQGSFSYSSDPALREKLMAFLQTHGRERRSHNIARSFHSLRQRARLSRYLTNFLRTQAQREWDQLNRALTSSFVSKHSAGSTMPRRMMELEKIAAQTQKFEATLRLLYALISRRFFDIQANANPIYRTEIEPSPVGHSAGGSSSAGSTLQYLYSDQLTGGIDDGFHFVTVSLGSGQQCKVLVAAKAAGRWGPATGATSNLTPTANADVCQCMLALLQQSPLCSGVDYRLRGKGSSFRDSVFNNIFMHSELTTFGLDFLQAKQIICSILSRCLTLAHLHTARMLATSIAPALTDMTALRAAGAVTPKDVKGLCMDIQQSIVLQSEGYALTGLSLADFSRMFTPEHFRSVLKLLYYNYDPLSSAALQLLYRIDHRQNNCAVFVKEFFLFGSRSDSAGNEFVAYMRTMLQKAATLLSFKDPDTSIASVAAFRALIITGREIPQMSSSSDWRFAGLVDFLFDGLRVSPDKLHFPAAASASTASATAGAARVAAQSALSRMVATALSRLGPRLGPSEHPSPPGLQTETADAEADSRHSHEPETEPPSNNPQIARRRVLNIRNKAASLLPPLDVEPKPMGSVAPNTQQQQPAAVVDLVHSQHGRTVHFAAATVAPGPPGGIWSGRLSRGPTELTLCEEILSHTVLTERQHHMRNSKIHEVILAVVRHQLHDIFVRQEGHHHHQQQQRTSSAPLHQSEAQTHAQHRGGTSPELNDGARHVLEVCLIFLRAFVLRNKENAACLASRDSLTLLTDVRLVHEEATNLIIDLISMLPDLVIPIVEQQVKAAAKHVNQWIPALLLLSAQHQSGAIRGGEDQQQQQQQKIARESAVCSNGDSIAQIEEINLELAFLRSVMSKASPELQLGPALQAVAEQLTEVATGPSGSALLRLAVCQTPNTSVQLLCTEFYNATGQVVPAVNENAAELTNTSYNYLHDLVRIPESAPLKLHLRLVDLLALLAEKNRAAKTLCTEMLPPLEALCAICLIDNHEIRAPYMHALLSVAVQGSTQRLDRNKGVIQVLGTILTDLNRYALLAFSAAEYVSEGPTRSHWIELTRLEDYLLVTALPFLIAYLQSCDKRLSIGPRKQSQDQGVMLAILQRLALLAEGHSHLAAQARFRELMVEFEKYFLQSKFFEWIRHKLNGDNDEARAYKTLQSFTERAAATASATGSSEITVATDPVIASDIERFVVQAWHTLDSLNERSRSAAAKDGGTSFSALLDPVMSASSQFTISEFDQLFRSIALARFPGEMQREKSATSALLQSFASVRAGMKLMAQESEDVARTQLLAAFDSWSQHGGKMVKVLFEHLTRRLIQGSSAEYLVKMCDYWVAVVTLGALASRHQEIQAKFVDDDDDLAEELEYERTRLAAVQRICLDCSACDFCISILCQKQGDLFVGGHGVHSGGRQCTFMALKLAVDLLGRGNTAVQNYFLDKMKSIAADPDGAGWDLLKTVRLIFQHYCAVVSFSKQALTDTEVSEIEATLNVLRLLTENQNLQMKLYLAAQGTFKDVNLVVEVTNFANVVLKKLAEVTARFLCQPVELNDGVAPSTSFGRCKSGVINWQLHFDHILGRQFAQLVRLATSTIRCLNEFATGPCPQNQQMIIGSGVLSNFVGIFKFLGAFQLIRECKDLVPLETESSSNNTAGGEGEEEEEEDEKYAWPRLYAASMQKIIVHDMFGKRSRVVDVSTARQHWVGSDPIACTMLIRRQNSQSVLALTKGERHRGSGEHSKFSSIVAAAIVVSKVTGSKVLPSRPESDSLSRWFQSLVEEKRAYLSHIASSSASGIFETNIDEEELERNSYAKIARLQNALVELELGMLEFLESILEGAQVGTIDDSLGYIGDSIGLEGVLQNNMACCWSRYLQSLRQNNFLVSMLAGADSAASTTQDSEAASAYYCLLMRLQDLGVRDLGIHEWIARENIPVSHYIARIEIFEQAKSAISVAYFPIPGLVRLYWASPEVKKLKLEILRLEKKDSLDEKLECFFNEGRRLMEFLRHYQWLDTQASRQRWPLPFLRLIKNLDVLALLCLACTISLNMILIAYTKITPDATAYFTLPLHGHIMDFLGGAQFALLVVITCCFTVLHGWLFVRSGFEENPSCAITVPTKYFTVLGMLVPWWRLVWPLVLRAEVNEATGQVTLHSSQVCAALYFYFSRPITQYKWLLLSFGTLGYFNNHFWYAGSLIEAVRIIKLMKEVSQAFTDNMGQLLMTILLGAMTIYFFVVVSVSSPHLLNEYTFAGYGGCDSLNSCLRLHFDYGLLTPPTWKDPGDIQYAPAELFNFAFVFIVMMCFPGIVTGIIIDAFSKLREKKRTAHDDLANKCYICDIDRNDFESEKLDFQHHLQNDHNMWKYLWFLIYLDEKSSEDYNGIEQYVADCVATDNSLLWLPRKKAMVLVKPRDRYDLFTIYSKITALKEQLGALEESVLLSTRERGGAASAES